MLVKLVCQRILLTMGKLTLLFPKKRSGLLTTEIIETIFSAQTFNPSATFRLSARGVDDEEKEYDADSNCRAAKRIFPDRRGTAQVTDLHDSRGQGDARCRLGRDLRV